MEVEYARKDGSIAGDRVWLVDFEDPARNDWLAVNQFTVIEAQHNRRPDIVAFVNGLPLGLIELKNAADEDATIWTAYQQLQTYKAEIPSLLHYNGVLVVSDGLQARIGSLTANQEWFKVWRTIDGEHDAPKTMHELEVLVRGVFDQRPVSRPAPAFHRFRGGPRQRPAEQDHCRLPSDACRQRRRRRDRARERHGGSWRVGGGGQWQLLGGQDAWRQDR